MIICGIRMIVLDPCIDLVLDVKFADSTLCVVVAVVVVYFED